ncbi:uncharacterized protein FIBRA_04977 [Fibroporia radiculosa]|uniref:NYN domain-containing protein n=1 Tax=Fibroporia radiculosa TaxID=599839 RepID=J4GQ63_9APHY|nr:uncharacterized protein FIBRA_04977 [Fibroporia radiculosa]CCM02865.1 predicted protein [Fibroporia radiculosa]
MSDLRHVAIFWDYENCSPPCAISGFDIVDNIRDIAHQYGSVKLFKAYLALSEQASSKSIIGMRSELQSCGVSLTDCPHNGKKERLDRSFHCPVDMLTYAIDTPAPATILLISGDRDFVYAVSVLRLRKYNVVLVAPNSSHSSLRVQASVVLDWDSDVLGKSTNGNQRSASTDAATHPNVGPNTHRRSQSSLSILETTPQTPQRQRGHSFRGTLSTPVVESPQTMGASPRLQTKLPPDAGHSLPPTSHLTPLDKSAISPVPESSVVIPASTSGQSAIDDSGPIADLNMHLRTLGNTSAPDSSLHPKLTISTPADAVFKPMIHSSTPAPREVRTVATPNTPSPHMSSSPLSANSSGPTTPADTAQIQVSINGQKAVVPLINATDNRQCSSEFPPRCIATGVSVKCGPGQRAAEGALADSGISGFAQSTVVAPAAKTVPTASESRTISAPQDVTDKLPLVPPPPIGASGIIRYGLPTIGKPSPPVIARPPTTISYTIPPEYSTLIHLLEHHRVRGIERPIRSVIACALVERDRNAYTMVGVQRWREYAESAVRAGIITLGGVQGEAWVSLTPAWHNKVAVPGQ